MHPRRLRAAVLRKDRLAGVRAIDREAGYAMCHRLGSRRRVVTLGRHSGGKCLGGHIDT